jgi:uncharacterized coiled-coil protein SlyX
MREMIEARLAELRAEAAKGEQALMELDTKRAELGRMMLRISGAVQVLEETLAMADESASAADGSGSIVGSMADGSGSIAGSTADGSGSIVGSAADGSGSIVGSTADGSGSIVGSTAGGSGSIVGSAADGSGSIVGAAASAAVAA